MKLEKKHEEEEKEEEEYNVHQDIALVRDSLEYYDKYFELYNQKFDKFHYIKLIKNNNDHIHDEMCFYDENKNVLFKSRFEFIGMHEPQMHIWTWAWSLPFLQKKNTSIIRKILNYGAELEPTGDFLKSELITSRFKIIHSIQLDIHAAISAYLAKKPVIYKFKFYDFAEYDENNLLNIKNYTIDNGETSPNFVYYYLYLLDYDQFIK